jgi:hypothetical protein
MPDHWDQSRFDASLKRYLEVTHKKTLPQILNTKGFFISRGATRLTLKADRSRIEASLGRVVTANQVTTNKRTGISRVSKRKQLVIARNNSRSSAPLAALILQKRTAKSGHRSPFYGKKRAAGIAAMNQKVQRMIGLRVRSRSFVASGWIPSIKKLAPLASRSGAPAMDESTRQYGRAKGDAKPAMPGWAPQVQITNLAFGNKTSPAGRERGMKVGTRGLQSSFDQETRSMDKFTEEKMKADADRFNQEQR